jgi:hypothetical protein
LFSDVLAYIDGFMIIGFAVIGAVLLMMLLRTPPAGTLASPGGAIAAPAEPPPLIIRHGWPGSARREAQVKKRAA